MPSMPPRKKQSSSHWGWWLFVLLVIAGLLVYFKYPQLLHLPWSQPSGSTQAAPALDKICSANVSFQYSHPKQGYAASLQELGPEGAQYVDRPLATGEKSGYRFQYVARPESSGLIEHYQVNARPQHYGVDGKRSYYSDEDCDVHYTDEDRAATRKDTVLTKKK
jgi:hypothetical protein